jgi:hypothetical protein
LAPGFGTLEDAKPDLKAEMTSCRERERHAGVEQESAVTLRICLQRLAGRGRFRRSAGKGQAEPGVDSDQLRRPVANPDVSVQPEAFLRVVVAERKLAA